MSFSLRTSSEVDMPFVRCHDEVEFECALWGLIQLYYKREIPDVPLLLVVLRRLFHLFYLIDRLEYWWRDRMFDSRICAHWYSLMAVWHNVEIFSFFLRLVV